MAWYSWHGKTRFEWSFFILFCGCSNKLQVWLPCTFAGARNRTSSSLWGRNLNVFVDVPRYAQIEKLNRKIMEDWFSTSSGIWLLWTRESQASDWRPQEEVFKIWPDLVQLSMFRKNLLLLVWCHTCVDKMWREVIGFQFQHVSCLISISVKCDQEKAWNKVLLSCWPELTMRPDIWTHLWWSCPQSWTLGPRQAGTLKRTQGFIRCLRLWIARWPCHGCWKLRVWVCGARSDA